MNEIVPSNVQTLLDAWLEAERNGNPFPVPFDIAYQMAGYSRKDSAKRYLPKRSQGKVYHVSVENSQKQGGRPKEVISLSIDGLKHLCLMADTPEGAAIRDYYIDAENKWKLTQQIAPQVASEVETIHLQIQLATLENQKVENELKLAQFRHYVTTALPEPQQQKVLGYNEVKIVEYRDRTITPEGERLDGVGITAIQRRFGFKSTKQTWGWLESIGYGKESGYWKPELTAVETHKLDADLLVELDRLADKGMRQRWLGE